MRAGRRCGGAQIQGRRDALQPRQLRLAPHPAHQLPQPLHGGRLGEGTRPRRQRPVAGQTAILVLINPVSPTSFSHKRRADGRGAFTTLGANEWVSITLRHWHCIVRMQERAALPANALPLPNFGQLALHNFLIGFTGGRCGGECICDGAGGSQYGGRHPRTGSGCKCGLEKEGEKAMQTWLPYHAGASVCDGAGGSQHGCGYPGAGPGRR